MKTQKQTSLAIALAGYEDRIKGKFRPDRRFYDSVGINQKRFGQLVREEKPILAYEARNLSNFFGVALDDLI